jgi:co-chaperonin GroES (HSP10)
MQIDTNRYARCVTPADQKAAILADLTPKLADIRVLRNRVLVCTYVEAEVTAGGILKPQSRIDESKYQGKVGLVLKVGPMAFQFDEVLEDIQKVDAQAAFEHHGVPLIGDWVFFRASDTWDCGLAVEPGKGVHCRFINDDSIVGVITDPSSIW